MATKYWVGGNGNWSSLTNWRTTSGGAIVTTAPGSADAAVLDANSSTSVVTVDSNITIQTLTCTGFTGTLAFGTNTISLNSTGTVFTGATTMTVTGTPQIILTNNSATARTITPTAVTEANSISFRITAGTGTFTITTSQGVRDLDFTDGVNPTGYAGALQGGNVNIYGNLKVSTGMTVVAGTGIFNFNATSGTKTINTAGVTVDRPFTFNGVGGTFQLQAALTSGDTRTCTLTAGTLDLVSYTLTTGIFNSNTSTTRTLAFGTGKIVVTGNNATVCTTSTGTALTVTGSKRVELSYSGSTGTRTINGATNATVIEGTNLLDYFFTAGSDTITFTATRGYGTIDFSNGGTSTFTGTWTNGAAQVNVYGNLILNSAMTVGGGTSAVEMKATSGTKTITSAGQTLDFPFTINGLGGTFSLSDALTVGSTRVLSLTAGTLTTNGYAVSSQQFFASGTGVRTLNLGATTFTLVGSPTWNIADPTNMTLNAGTSTITFSPTIAGNVGISTGGLTYNNFSFPSAPAFTQIFILTGNFTANNFSATAPLSSSYIKSFLISGGCTPTITGTLTLTGSNGNQRITFKAYNTTSASVVTANAVSLTDVDFQNITAAGAAISWTGTRLGNCGGNTNITFAAGKNCYFNFPAGGNWNDNVWALTSGGAVATTNYPLPQDTAIFDNTGINAGSVVAMYQNAPNSVGAVNFSALTNSITWNFADTAGFVNIFGDLTLTSFVTVTGTSPGLRLDATRGTVNITSAGASFGAASCGNQTAINSGYDIKFLNNFLTVGTFLLQTANLDLNGKTLTCNIFSSSYSAGFAQTRVIAFNAGDIAVTGNNATVWICADLTGFSYTGTPTVNFTYSGSVGSRQINHGNTAGGIETNAIDVNIVAGSDAIGTAGVVRNFTLQPAFNGSSGLYSSGFIYGNLTLSASQTVSASTNATTFAATSGTKTITTNGVTVDRPFTFDGLGGSWVLGSALTLGASNTGLLFVRGTFSTANYNVTATRWFYEYLTVIGTVVLNLGSSTITLIPYSVGSIGIPWQMGGIAVNPLTVNGGTSNIVFNTTVAQASFNPNSLANVTYYKLTQAGTNTLLINDVVTLNTLQNIAQPTTIAFKEGITHTVDNFNVSGTAGNLVTLASKTPGSQFTLAKRTGGKVLVSYVSVTDSAASPTGYWFAPTSQGNVDGGNNTGWNFASAGGAGGFLPFF